MDLAAINRAAALLAARKGQFETERDRAEDARWAEELAREPIILLARKLARQHDRDATKPRLVSLGRTREDRECDSEEQEENAKSLLALAESIERSEARKIDLANGIERKPRQLEHRIRVAAIHNDRPAAADGKKPKVSRTEAHRAQQEAALQAKQAETAARAQAAGLPPPQFTQIKVHVGNSLFHRAGRFL
jgi:hypothetical protein